MENFTFASDEVVSLSLMRSKWRDLSVSTEVIGFFHPHQESSIRALPDFHPVEMYAQMRQMHEHELGCNEMVRFVPVQEGIGGA